jgi:iron complex outermembrane receptor protein
MFGSSLTFSQDTVESEVVEAAVAEVVDNAATSVEEVVVTGSRLKRSTFTSISPLQIVTAEISRESGLVNAADILQTSTSAGGQQIDLTFSGFVLDNGPGSRTVNLRGLGANRTLLLINGRRLAPGGAEGAPYAPDAGLIPSGLVSQYEVLTDGASSVYGSDAIGGVTNVILRQDFDGLTMEAGSYIPKYSGGDNRSLSITWGETYDKGFVGFGLDYSRDKRATFGILPSKVYCHK